MVMSVRTVKLNNGAEMPLVGLGCWKIPNEVAAEQVYEAIKLGYRLLDGAEDYANEREVGQGIRRAIDEGVVRREELFVVSKLWNNYHHPDNVRKALQRTLSDLGLDYLDMFYIHFPLAFEFVPMEERYPPGLYTGAADEKAGRLAQEPVPLIETYRALEQLVDEGLIRAIGLSNFQGCLVQDLLRGCRIRPAALQIEHHPYLTQERLVQYAKSEGLAVVGYSSLGPQSFLELGNKTAQGATPLLQHEVVCRIAERHSSTPAEVLLHWATQRDIAVIPKSSRKERLATNLRVDEAITLTDDELRELSSLNCNMRFNDPWDWCDQPLPTFV
ncbi:AaceriACL107Cp [[Ashbya] aceris (nom. inval.)]|nr:AaceriACL107Cp [[Ashbya] aceris (nom. inval.)]